MIAMATSDFTRQASPDGAVTIGDLIMVLSTFFRLYSGKQFRHHALGENAFIPGLVRRGLAKARLAVIDLVILQNGLQIQITLFFTLALQHLQQIGATDQLVETTDTELGE